MSEAERHEGDGWPVLGFVDQAALERYLEQHHDDATGFWLKFAKVGSGLASVAFEEARESTICFGWVDSKMHRYDERHYVARYARRGRRSTWGPKNRAVAERMIAAGRMRPSGLASVEQARARGAWGDPP